MPLGYIQLNNAWFYAHLTASEQSSKYVCVVLYSPEAVLEDIVSINIMVPLSRIQFQTVKHFKKEKERRVSRGHLFNEENVGMFRDVSLKKFEKDILAEFERLEALEEGREENIQEKKRRNSHAELAVTESTLHLYATESLADMQEEMQREMERLSAMQNGEGVVVGIAEDQPCRGQLLKPDNADRWGKDSLDMMQNDMAQHLQQLKISLGHSNPDFHIEHDDPYTPASSLSTGSDRDYTDESDDLYTPNSQLSDMSHLDALLDTGSMKTPNTGDANSYSPLDPLITPKNYKNENFNARFEGF